MSPEKVYVSTLSKKFRFGDKEAIGSIAIVDGEVGLTHTQLKILFDLNDFSIRHTLNTRKIPYRELAIKDCSALIEEKLISPTLKKIIFVSKNSVEELLLHIGTNANLEFFDFIFMNEKVGVKFGCRDSEVSNKILPNRIAALEKEIASLKAKMK
ncbi:MAG: hypothetical protein EOP04_04175 [Proteobacteria bacterium]|nr:MAG: hypothetical protein EOP04_04175 [Pseudomonadota bacterium]